MKSLEEKMQCQGKPCPLWEKPAGHLHMPPEPYDGPNADLEITDPQVIAIADEILGNRKKGIVGSYDGLTVTPSGERDHDYEFARILEELGALSVNHSNEMVTL